jgi:hypothetical protein
MFDGPVSENKAEEALDPQGEKQTTSAGLERWAHFPGLLVFGLLIIPLHRYPWGWHVAIAGGYTVCVFWFALGSGKKDLDDIFGDQDTPRKVRMLIVPHIIVLAILLWAVSEWFHLKRLLPSWATQEGRRGSLWLQFGFLSLAIAAVAQGFWMAKKIQLKFPDPSESD